MAVISLVLYIHTVPLLPILFRKHLWRLQIKAFSRITRPRTRKYEAGLLNNELSLYQLRTSPPIINWFSIADDD